MCIGWIVVVVTFLFVFFFGLGGHDEAGCVLMAWTSDEVSWSGGFMAGLVVCTILHTYITLVVHS